MITSFLSIQLYHHTIWTLTTHGTLPLGIQAPCPIYTLNWIWSIFSWAICPHQFVAVELVSSSSKCFIAGSIESKAFCNGSHRNIYLLQRDYRKELVFNTCQVACVLYAVGNLPFWVATLGTHDDIPLFTAALTWYYSLLKI